MLPITISRHLHLFHRCFCYADLRQTSLGMLTRTVRSGEALVMCGENTPCFSLYTLCPSLPGKFFLKVPPNGRGVAYSKSITGKLQSEFCNRESPCPTLQAFVATPDYPQTSDDCSPLVPLPLPPPSRVDQISAVGASSCCFHVY